MRLSGRKLSSFTRSWTPQSRLVLLGLIGANIGAFCGQVLLDAYQPGFVNEFLGLSDAGLGSAYAWQFFTAIFLHNGPWYLAVNMLVLYLVGRDVESIIGQRQFFLLYLGGAVGGELSHLFLMPADTVLFAGSGGVVAVLIAYATILPELELTALIFMILPVRLKAKHVGYGVFYLGLLGLIFVRQGIVTHSVTLGACAAGWLYAHLLGFGRPSIVQRRVQQRRIEVDRYQTMSSEQFIVEKVDPVLDKISREGMQSLTSSERRTLAMAREKIEGKKKPRPA
jgi:membrane associated rhomboid family serine protease